MKRIVALALGLAMVLAGASVAAQNVLVYGTTDKVTDMDPASSYDFHTWEIFQNIDKGLLTYTPGTTDIVPGLATGYTVNTAGTEYTFKLRPGLKFTDGTPFDAASVKWSVDRVAKLNGDPSWLVTTFVKEVQVVDPLTVKFVLKAPTGFFPALVAGDPVYFPVSPNVYPVDKIIHDPSELPGGALVGLGPYKVTSFKRDEEVVLEANPAYYGKQPPVKKVIIKYFADATTMRLAIEKGDIDIAFKTLNPSDITDLAKAGKLSYQKLPGAQTRFLNFNCDVSVFKNKILRQAVAALIDRPEINQKVFLGQQAPLYSMIPMGMSYHTDNFKTVYGEKGNVAKADKLLQQAGYSKAKPFAFDLWYTTSHYGDTEVNVAEVLKSQLERSPLIKVTLKSAEWATYKQQFNNKQMAAFLLGWYPDYLDPDDYTAAFAQTDASAGEGIFFSNKEWDALFTKEQTATSEKARAPVFAEVQKLWTDEVPCIPLFQGNLNVFTKKNVTGVKIGPTLIFNYDSVYFK
ncbi:MAG TPA: ABC transporter substrate-binding protein [Rectinemataceae bacterium]|nr:ABC transporter substrate-binding protein [Rectinemataceae bacterium]